MNLRSATAAVGLLCLVAVSLGSCANESSERETSADGTVGSGSTAPGQRIAGDEAIGPYIRVDDLTVAASDGRLVWMSDDAGRLLAVDGTNGKIEHDRKLDTVLADTPGLIAAPNGTELWGIAKTEAQRRHPAPPAVRRSNRIHCFGSVWGSVAGGALKGCGGQRLGREPGVRWLPERG